MKHSFLIPRQDMKPSTNHRILSRLLFIIAFIICSISAEAKIVHKYECLGGNDIYDAPTYYANKIGYLKDGKTIEVDPVAEGAKWVEFTFEGKQAYIPMNAIIFRREIRTGDDAVYALKEIDTLTQSIAQNEDTTLENDRKTRIWQLVICALVVIAALLTKIEDFLTDGIAIVLLTLSSILTLVRVLTVGLNNFIYAWYDIIFMDELIFMAIYGLFIYATVKVYNTINLEVEEMKETIEENEKTNTDGNNTWILGHFISNSGAVLLALDMILAWGKWSLILTIVAILQALFCIGIWSDCKKNSMSNISASIIIVSWLINSTMVTILGITVYHTFGVVLAIIAAIICGIFVVGIPVLIVSGGSKVLTTGGKLTQILGGNWVDKVGNIFEYIGNGKFRKKQ